MNIWVQITITLAQIIWEHGGRETLEKLRAMNPKTDQEIKKELKEIAERNGSTPI